MLHGLDGEYADGCVPWYGYLDEGDEEEEDENEFDDIDDYYYSDRYFDHL